MEFFDQFLERLPSPVPANEMTYQCECDRVYESYCLWTRIEKKRSPAEKELFWQALRAWHSSVTVVGTPRGRIFVGVRFRGYYPKRPKTGILGHGLKR